LSATTTSRGAAALLAGLLLAGCGGPRALDTGESMVTGGTGPDAVWERDLGRALEFPAVWAGDSWLAAGTAGSLVRLDPGTGEEIWKRKLPATPLAAPLVQGDLVVQATDAPGGVVLGLALADGEERWHWERGLALPAAADSILVLAIRNRGLVRLDPRTGKTVWRVTHSGAGWRTPVVAAADSLVLVPVRPDSVIALAVADGRRVWSRETGPWPRLTLAGERLLVAADDSTLGRLDARTGQVGPRVRLDAMPAGAPVAAGPRIVQAVRDGTVRVYDPDSLRLLWKTRLEPPLVSAPCVIDSLIFQAAPRGRVEVLGLEGGQVLASYHHPDLLITRPAANGNELAVGGDHGMLVIYRREP